MPRPERIRVIILFLIILLMLPGRGILAQSTDDTSSTGDTEESTAEFIQPEENASADDAVPGDISTLESFNTEDEGSPKLGPTTAQYVKVFVGLAITLLLVWGISILMKKFFTAQGLVSKSESLKVLYTLSLSPTRTLYLIRVADRVLLIGAGEGGLRTLTEITDTEEVSSILRDVEYKGNIDLNPFRDKLQTLMGEDDITPERDENLDVRQRKLKSSMDKLKDNSGDE